MLRKILLGLLLVLMAPCLVIAQGDMIEVNGIDMYYEVHGQGDPLILLHGWTQSSQFWNDYINHYIFDYAVYIPDLRGHGQSTPLDESFSIQQTAKDVIAFMDELGIQDAKMIGFSFGGLVTLEMVMLDPQKIKKLILVSAAYQYNGEDGPTYKYDDMPKDFKTYLASTHIYGENQIRAMFNPKLDYQIKLSKEELKAFDMPTMIIGGDNDRNIDIVRLVEMHQAIPNSSLLIMPNTGHMVIEPVAKMSFLEMTLSFLRD